MPLRFLRANKAGCGKLWWLPVPVSDKVVRGAFGFHEAVLELSFFLDGISHRPPQRLSRGMNRFSYVGVVP